MNKREVKQYGIERGMFFGNGALEKNPSYDEDEYREHAFDCEDLDRQMSPFEFLAHDINETGDRAEGLWEAFDEGIAKGIDVIWGRSRKLKKAS